MRANLSFLFTLLVCTSFYLCRSQSNLQVSLSPQLPAGDFGFYSLGRYNSWEGPQNYQYAGALQISYRYHLSRNVFLTSQIEVFRFSQRYEEMSFFEESGVINDFIPLQSVWNYVFPKIGFGYTSNPRKDNGFAAGVSFNGGLPFGSYHFVRGYDNSEFRLDQYKYSNPSFKEGIMWGSSLWGEASFLLSKSRTTKGYLTAGLSTSGYFQPEGFIPFKYKLGPTVGYMLKFK